MATREGQRGNLQVDRSSLDPLPTSQGAHEASTGLDLVGQRNKNSVSAPKLVHQIQIEKSVLTLVISIDRIYAGTQEGDVLVCSTSPHWILEA